MTLSTFALTTFDTVNDTLGGPIIALSPAQSVVERLINAVSRAMQNVAGERPFERQIDRVENKRGYGQFQLVMDTAPIVSINQIVLLDIDGSTITTYDSDSFIVDKPDEGIIYRPGGWVWTAGVRDDIRLTPMPTTERAQIEVTYTAGWITPFQETVPGGDLGTRDLPEDLEEACIWSVVSAWRSTNRDRNVVSQSNADVNTTFRETNKTGLLLPETVAVAEQYQRFLLGNN